MDGTDDVLDGDPQAVICVDEFGPLNLQPHPGRQWAPARRLPGRAASPPAARHLHPPAGVRHLLAAYDLTRDRLYGHIKPRKRRGEFLVFLPLPAIALPARGTARDRAGQLQPAPDDQERQPGRRLGSGQQRRTGLYRPTQAGSTASRPSSQALRYFTLDGTDHPSHHAQGQHDPPLHRLAEPHTPTTNGSEKSSTGQRLPDAALAPEH